MSIMKETRQLHINRLFIAKFRSVKVTVTRNFNFYLPNAAAPAFIFDFDICVLFFESYQHYNLLP